MGAEKGSSFSLRISTQSMENALQPDTARPTAEAMNPLRDARPRLGDGRFISECPELEAQPRG